MQTPWKIVFQGEDYGLVDAKGNVIACNESYYPSAPSLDAAKLIVRAVNSHQALVEALEVAKYWLSPPLGQKMTDSYKLIDKALKLAKGE